MTGGESHDSTAPCRWVFVKQSQCIQVVRLPDLSVAIDGLRQSQANYHFDTEQQFETFPVALAEHLTERGWLLLLSTSR
jgi:hypothetical protein